MALFRHVRFMDEIARGNMHFFLRTRRNLIGICYSIYASFRKDDAKISLFNEFVLAKSPSCQFSSRLVLRSSYLHMMPMKEVRSGRYLVDSGWCFIWMLALRKSNILLRPLDFVLFNLSSFTTHLYLNMQYYGVIYF